MKYNMKPTCSQIRFVGNGMMAAGFLLLCVAVGTYGGGDGLCEYFGMTGSVLLSAGFVGKLVGWRCPGCGTHLMLCAGRKEKECPCCGMSLRSQK